MTFKKINKVDKLLAKLKRRDETNMREETLVQFTEFKRIIRNIWITLFQYMTT